MASTVLQKVVVSVLLNNGTDAQGNTKVIAVAFPTVDKSAYDEDEALAIAGALNTIFDKSIESVRQVETSTVVSD